jgi:hypothetical protein
MQPVFDKISWAVTTPHELEHFFLGQVVNDPGWLFLLMKALLKLNPYLKIWCPTKLNWRR